MALPVFTPRPVSQERDAWGRLPPVETWPRCRCCPEPGPVDDATHLGLECWRATVLARWWAKRRDVCDDCGGELAMGACPRCGEARIG